MKTKTSFQKFKNLKRGVFNTGYGACSFGGKQSRQFLLCFLFFSKLISYSLFLALFLLFIWKQSMETNTGIYSNGDSSPKNGSAVGDQLSSSPERSSSPNVCFLYIFYPLYCIAIFRNQKKLQSSDVLQMVFFRMNLSTTSH